MPNIFNTRNIIALVAALATSAVIGFVAKTYWHSAQPAEIPPLTSENSSLSLDISKRYTVQRIIVLDGDTFDVILDNDKRYFIRLVGSFGCPAEAREQVLKHINEAKRKGFAIKLTPYEWDCMSACWKVTLKINNEDLLNWLIENNLAYRK